MAQGARRPARHQRQSRQILTHRKSDHVRETTGSACQENDITADRIISILSSSQIYLSTASSRSDEDAIKAYLPPITALADVNFELYALLAIIINLCIQSWYQRITPDREINDEIVSIIVASIQAVIQRMATIDIGNLILDDTPMILLEHLEAIEFCRRAPHGLDRDATIRKTFHAIRPHVALDPTPITPTDYMLQQENEAAWTQILVDKVLPLVLPPADLHNPGLVVVVKELFSEMIMHNGVCDKLSEPYFIWETITRILALTKLAERHTAVESTTGNTDQRSNGVHTLLDILLSSFSVAWTSILSLWSLLLILIDERRFYIPSVSPAMLVGSTELEVHGPDIGVSPEPHDRQKDISLTRRPLLTAKIWTCVAHLTRIRLRMPWLAGGMSLLQWLLLHGPRNVGGNGSTLDRWLTTQIDATLLTPSLLPGVLRAARQSLFPGRAFAPARSRPSPEEISTIRAECASVIVDSIPPLVRTIYFATMDRGLMERDVLETLDLFADPYINKALIISMVELFVANLFPELVSAES